MVTNGRTRSVAHLENTRSAQSARTTHCGNGAWQMNKKKTIFEEKVIGFKDVDLIEQLSARCRRKYKRAKTEEERDKYAKFLELINERILTIQEELEEEIKNLKKEE